uniref:Serine/threonine-protein phosphatase 4 regulatory subunit 3-like central domain-containing protein n=1 Tax=Arcella intermedia TaxID=1963864 RepID=A0A6B2L1J0_9EUKA
MSDFLDEDETVVETKNLKKDLITFLVKKENIEQLVTYVVDDPPQDAPTKVKFRYPVVACEILCSEVNDIEMVLMKDTTMLNRIFDFFKKKKINLLLANLVLKIAKTLTITKTELIFKYLQDRPSFIDSFLTHLESAAVPEYFSGIVSISGEKGGIDTQKFLSQQNFAEKIIGKFETEQQDLYPDIAAAVLDVVGAASWGGRLMNDFVSERIAKMLLRIMMVAKNWKAFKYGMKILNRVLRAVAVAQDLEVDEDKASSCPPKPDPAGPMSQLPPVVQVFVSHLPKFSEILKNSNSSIKKNTNFGFERLYLLETLETLISLNYVAVQKVLLESDIFKIAFDLVYQFPQNNICHKAVEGVITKFLDQLQPEDITRSCDKMNLIKRLTDSERLITEALQKKERHPPYIPYLHRIGFAVYLLGGKSPFIKSYLESDPKWGAFIERVISERKKNEALSSKMKATAQDDLAFTTDPENDQEDSDDEENNPDLLLDEDKDLDSANDAEDYEIDQSEILLTKQEVEAFA